jgi:hypothetical protein
VPIREIVSQISPPMRILLAGAVVFLAVWFTLLRPKASEDTSATTTTPAGNVNTGQPAQSEAGKIVEKAKTAATEAEGAAKAAAGEATTDATKTTPGTATTTTPDANAATAAIPAKQLEDLPKDVAKAVTGHKVMVLAVLADKGKHWRPMSDEDRYVRNTLKKVNRYDGDVFVKQVPLAKIDSYGVLVNDLDINQTPSVVVVDAKLKANVLAGYLDRVSINQAIADARADSITPLITDSYLKSANKVCANFTVSMDRWSNPTVHGRKAFIAAMKRQATELRNYRIAVRRLAAPKKWRGLRKQWLKWLAVEQTRVDKALKAAKKSKAEGTSVDAWNLSLFATDGGRIKDLRKLDARFNDAGLTSCAINRSK